MDDPLREAFDRLQRQPLPGKDTDSDELFDWLLELDETETYLAGLAHTALNGGHTKVRDHVVDDLADRLAAIAVESEDDLRIKRESAEYLRVLKGVHTCLKGHEAGHRRSSSAGK
jgi:hypothetical protein